MAPLCDSSVGNLVEEGRRPNHMRKHSPLRMPTWYVIQRHANLLEANVENQGSRQPTIVPFGDFEADVLRGELRKGR